MQAIGARADLQLRVVASHRCVECSHALRMAWRFEWWVWVGRNGGFHVKHLPCPGGTRRVRGPILRQRAEVDIVF